MVYSFSHISQSPHFRSSPTKQGKTYGHRPQRPKWTEGLHKTRCSLVLQGDRLRHCYHYPTARYLPPWLGQTRARLASAFLSNPLKGIPSTPVTASHVTQGTDLHVTLRYVQGVGLMGALVGAKYKADHHHHHYQYDPEISSYANPYHKTRLSTPDHGGDYDQIAP